EIVQEELFPRGDAATAREFLRTMMGKGWARRFDPSSKTARYAPVYFPTQQSAQRLALHYNDQRFKLEVEPRMHPQDLAHGLERSRIIIMLLKALAAQSFPYVQMLSLFTELEVRDVAAQEPGKRYWGFCEMKDDEAKRIVCVPDWVTLLQVEGFAP